MNRTNSSVPRLVFGMSIVLMFAGWLYQVVLTNQVAADFLARGNLPLRIAYILAVAALIAMLDVLVHRGDLSLGNDDGASRTDEAFIWAIALTIMSGVFVLEVGRLNVQFNGRPLAGEVSDELNNATRTTLVDVEKAIRTYPEDLSAKITERERLQKLVQAIESALDAEVNGTTRPEVERALRNEGIDFHFSGEVGNSRVTAKLRSILKEKQANLDTLGDEVDANKKAIDATRQADWVTMQGVRGGIVTMRGFNLGPDNYDRFMNIRDTAASEANALASKYSVALPDIPATQSLFIVSIKSAFTLSASAAVLWILAIGTCFGPALFLLGVRARYNRRQPASVTPIASVAGGSSP